MMRLQNWFVLISAIQFDGMAADHGWTRMDGFSAVSPSPFEESPVEIFDSMANFKSLNIDQKYTRWPKRSRIPYAIDSGYSPTEVALIKQAVAQITADMNYWITFTLVPVNSTEFKIKITPVKIDNFSPEAACYSFPGMLSIAPRLNMMGIHEQRLVLARGPNGCMDGTLHSIMKYLALVLGKRNEVQRGDRDQYIQMNMQNLTPLGKSAYKLSLKNESNWLMFPYDYCSVTHNQPTDFAVPDQMAFSVLKAPFFIPKLDHLSESDCRLLSLLYNADPSACNLFNCSALIPEFGSALPIKVVTPAATTIPQTTTTSATTLPTSTVPTTLSTSATVTRSTDSTTTMSTTSSTLLSTATIQSSTSITTPSTITTLNNLIPVATTVSPTDKLTATLSKFNDIFAMLFPPSSNNPNILQAPSLVTDGITIIKCPPTFCGVQIEHVSLHVDGQSSLLIAGGCGQLIDSSFGWVGRPQLLTDIFPNPNIEPPILAAWTDLNDLGQYRMHILDSAGIQRGCTLNRCDHEKRIRTNTQDSVSSVFAIQSGSSQFFRLFAIDKDKQSLKEINSSGAPLENHENTIVFGGTQPDPAWSSLTTGWMFYSPTGAPVVALIGQDDTSRQFIAGVYANLNVKPPTFTLNSFQFASNPPASPLSMILHPCE